jgi:hypothetical protein
MSVTTQRAFTRNKYQAPIHFSYPAADHQHEGEMVDSSIGGMGFVTSLELRPGDGILIHMVDMAPDPYWPEARSDYYAEVRWCRQQAGEPASLYRVGVRFLVETCRLCDETMYLISPEGRQVCDQCRDRFCSLSDGTITECIEKFLMGNVL